jgi:hypothetical protein
MCHVCVCLARDQIENHVGRLVEYVCLRRFCGSERRGGQYTCVYTPCKQLDRIAGPGENGPANLWAWNR